ncbi:MAG: DUF3473 domain-containing protein [Sphingobacteriales bacterium]|uniref:polysaccharide deacetylase family protein n=1 Tax=Hydrotalea flava TaxID=714549 RepID=UPI00082C7DA7|nr:polysaccharide deacetylase family protein [Hydrotalea flava]RTL56915.1 MAG: DUF3473 domain-containing protein [Sphingobacteriales bacterium]
MQEEKYILLSFDVEEFDMPLEYGQPISPEEQMNVGKKGTDVLESILQQHNISCTLFTTANYAIHFPKQIQQLAGTQEIASHTFYHSRFEEADLLLSKQRLAVISGQTITGLRMPRMQQVNIAALKAAGYLYDASVNPTWIPGRYNNRHLPRTWYTEQHIVRIPASVTPNLRIPLFWLAFKNMPLSLFVKFTLQTLRQDGYVSLYLHPWEFTELSNYQIPNYTKRYSGKRLEYRLHQFIEAMKQEGQFITMQQFMDKKCRPIQ